MLLNSGVRDILKQLLDDFGEVASPGTESNLDMAKILLPSLTT